MSEFTKHECGEGEQRSQLDDEPDELIGHKEESSRLQLPKIIGESIVGQKRSIPSSIGNPDEVRPQRPMQIGAYSPEGTQDLIG